jgi:NAD dependent epimerase/dehydratase family enzyme
MSVLGKSANKAALIQAATDNDWKTVNALWVKDMPAWVLKLLLGEMADLLLNGQNVQPTRLLNAGFQFRYPTLPEALQHIFED